MFTLTAGPQTSICCPLTSPCRTPPLKRSCLIALHLSVSRILSKRVQCSTKPRGTKRKGMSHIPQLLFRSMTLLVRDQHIVHIHTVYFTLISSQWSISDWSVASQCNNENGIQRIKDAAPLPCTFVIECFCCLLSKAFPFGGFVREEAWS